MERIGEVIKGLQEVGALPRFLKNLAERQLFKELTLQGWEVTKRGWPDFVCYKDGHLALVEVKPSRHKRLKKQQLRLMLALAEVGVRCFRRTPDGGFEPVASRGGGKSQLEEDHRDHT